MITVDRYPTTSHPSLSAARPGSHGPRWLPAWPALPGHRHLVETLGGSVLVQLMLAMSCVALAGLLYLAQANQASVLQYNIAELQVERVQLTAQDGTLRAAAMPLQSPQRIVSAAQTQLHMQQPNPSNTLWIAPTFSQVALPPSPAASSQAAQQRSQPLAWMRRVIGAVKASL